MAIAPIQSAVNKQAQPLPVIQMRMGYNGAQQRDPVQKAERDMTTLNADIDNNGGSLYNPETFCIVHRFETEDDKQRRENQESGYGAITDTQMSLIQECYFYAEYDDEPWFEDEPQFDEETYAFYDTHYDPYIEMVENGEMEDDGMSCRMTRADMGASLSEEEQDLEEDADFTAETDSEMEQDTSPNPELEEDDPTAETIDDQGIKSKIKLKSQFGKATSPAAEPEPETPAFEPIAIAPVPVAAANNPSYQMRA